MKRILLMVIVFLLTTLPVFGVIATYSTYPLKLESYNSIYMNKYGGTGTNHYQDMMAMHIGRFTIDTQGPKIRSLALISNISNEFEFIGPTTWNPDSTDTLGFHGVAILKYGSALYNSNLNQGNINPINPTNTPMDGIITIDFYLISHNPASIFLPNKNYTHQSGIVGNFSISYSKKNKDFWNTDFDPMPGPNGLPISPQPYLGSGTVTPDVAVPYEDPNVPLFDFSIIEQQESFDLQMAIGNSLALIAKAQVIVSNADASDPCGVTLTFSDGTAHEFFSMSHTEDSELPNISYKIHFDGNILGPGDSVDWVGFVNNTYTKDMFVTGISQTEVDNLVEGTYSDTITIHLTAKDT